ncbi:MAG: DUF4838 domain-containing protein [Bacteroidales bacterium]|nr:DUF4838 domain-containing protein [Bacteroidales bacterium]
MKKTAFLFLAFILCFSVTSQASKDIRLHSHESSTKVLLANKGSAKHSIVTSANASVDVKLAAQKLGEYLTKISGAKFTLNTDNGSKGIAVGVVGDFPNMGFNPDFDLIHPGQRQGYEIKSHKNGVYIIGATPLAVKYAVFDFLTQLGYRQFFPMEKWEIIPKKEKLEFASHIKEIPDYYHRRIWAGHGLWPEYKPSHEHWRMVNRDGGYALNTGHAYNAIVAANKAEFDKHPEYFALIDGKRNTETREIKFCISNPNLRQLVVNYALKRFAANPDLESFSMDPSDGGGWCQCDGCLKIGTPSTRAVFLANTVAQAVREKYKGKKIGMYAYNQHSPAPEIDVDKDVVLSVATRFIAGGLDLDHLIDSWTAKKAVLGIREYYDVLIWSKHLPGKSSGSNLAYLKRTIPDFYNRGARYLTSEASDDWISSGLGYYIAEKLLWNIDSDVSAIMDDFFDSAFGPSAQSIKEYYTYLDGSVPTVLASDPIGRMYRLLKQARQDAKDNNEILSRIDDLVLYTRYVELFNNYENASTVSAKQSSFNKLMDFVSGIKEYRIFHTKVLEETDRHWKNLSPNPNSYSKPVWKDVAYTSVEIEDFINSGIANNELLDFKPIEFSTELVPSNSFKKLNKPFGKLAPRRGKWTYYTWVDKKLSPINLLVTGGLIAHYRDRGNVKIQLYKLGGASEDGTYETLIQEDASTVPNGKPNMVVLTPNQEGLHAVTMSDGNDKTNDFWTNYDKTFQADKEVDGTFYFYVPKGTKQLGLYHKLLRGRLYDSKGREVYTFKNTSTFQSFPVKKGEDGKIWSFKNARGIIKLMTAPSYFSLNPKYLLLPKEVVEKDNLNSPTN